jgi:4-diphosphocytidyl-2-C-methyl-D-erythritol kinase
MNSAQLRNAPAKINLALHVVGQRADGYHLLETLVVFAGTADRVSVVPSTRDSFTVTGPEAAALADYLESENLVVRARDLARDVLTEADRPAVPVEIVLEKNLPAGSGIGGGSADAAATLDALAAVWDMDGLTARVHAGSAGLGADIPMCLTGRPLFARGIGDEIEMLAGIPALPIVLVNPRREVSTPAVFSRLSKKENAEIPPDEMPGDGNTHALCRWLAESTRNDLFDPAVQIEPAIADAMAALSTPDALLVRMSGSGATCYAIHKSIEKARASADALLKAHPDWWITATMTGASPAKGT